MCMLRMPFCRMMLTSRRRDSSAIKNVNPQMAAPIKCAQ